MEEPVLIIAGPTASGKESLAFELARRLGGEIVSMDSMKVYREINVATAKPPGSHREQVRYHLVDIVEPHVKFSTGTYLQRLDETLSSIRERGVPVIITGGTGLYLKGFLYGFQEGPSADWEFRRLLFAEANSRGTACLYERLTREDPVAAEKINPADLRRIVRALEVCSQTGGRLSDGWTWGQSTVDRPYPIHLFGIHWERERLYDRINRRVQKMVDSGLFEESLRLARRQPPLSRTAAQSIGYKEIVSGTQRGLSQDEITLLIQQESRRFAKRQMTWFRKFPIDWIDAGETDDPLCWADELQRRLR